MLKRGRRNVLLVSLSFFMMFVFFMLSFESVSAVACSSYDDFGWERTRGACTSAAGDALNECKNAGCEGTMDVEECFMDYIWSVDCFASTPVEEPDPCDVSWPVVGEALRVACNVDSSGARVSGSCSPGDYNIYTIKGKHADFWDCERSLGDVSYVTYSQVCEAAPGCVSPGPICGNGVVESPEDCDDGNANNNDGCSSSCLTESGYICGGKWSSGVSDGIGCEGDFTNVKYGALAGVCSPVGLTSSYVKFIGQAGPGTYNPANCRDVILELYTQTCVVDSSSCGPIPYCGDGSVNAAGEQCDDGNTRNDDGCSSSCKDEPLLECCDDDDNDGWMGATSVSDFFGTCTNAFSFGREKLCSDYTFFGSELSSCDSYASRNPGVAEICGNNIDENCDGIVAACPPTCSDGIQNQGEAGIDCGGTECSPCPSCGDGNVNAAGEECDDGNTNSNDGCSSTCKLESLLECCDDDDNDGWMGDSSYSAFFGTCTNAFSAGREKVCSDYTFSGTEGNTCDGDGSRNPGVKEVCGNNIDENCDGVIEICPISCSDGIKNGDEDGVDCGGTGCINECVLPPYCGNGRIDSGESCDDGVARSGDGCSSSCTVESGWICDGKSPTSCSLAPIMCCDDDDGDGWMGDSSVSSLFGTCTNAFNAGREKVCSSYSFSGTEGNTCDGDVSRNPGVAEVCGNNIDENCDGVAEVCPPTCNDRVKNGDEEGIDCGGLECFPCPRDPTCNDGIQNGEETGVDCGTVECGACVIPPYCGDGNVDAGEACDGNNFNGLTCGALPQYTGGPLSCFAPGAANECTVDFSGCIDIPVSRNYWANMNGNEIAVANFGDTIQLIAEDVVAGTFSIKEENVFLDDDIRDVVGVRENSNLVGVWTIEEVDMDQASDYDDFYFEAGGRKSGSLKITEDEGDDLMEISIEGDAGCGSYFDEGASVNVIVEASDADDIIVGSVSIYGEVREFSNGGISFNQVFNTPGSIQILVEANTLAGDDERRVISNVMVLDKTGGSYVDGNYVAACINEPEDFSNIIDSVVDFDVSSTSGIRVTDGIVRELIPGRDSFSWFWTFYPQGIERNFVDSTDTFAYHFTAKFPIAGVNTAELRVEVN